MNNDTMKDFTLSCFLFYFLDSVSCRDNSGLALGILNEMGEAPKLSWSSLNKIRHVVGIIRVAVSREYVIGIIWVAVSRGYFKYIKRIISLRGE